MLRIIKGKVAEGISPGRKLVLYKDLIVGDDGA